MLATQWGYGVYNPLKCYQGQESEEGTVNKAKLLELSSPEAGLSLLTLWTDKAPAAELSSVWLESAALLLPFCTPDLTGFCNKLITKFPGICFTLIINLKSQESKYGSIWKCNF